MKWFKRGSQKIEDKSDAERLIEHLDKCVGQANGDAYELARLMRQETSEIFEENSMPAGDIRMVRIDLINNEDIIAVDKMVELHDFPDTWTAAQLEASIRSRLGFSAMCDIDWLFKKGPSGGDREDLKELRPLIAKNYGRPLRQVAKEVVLANADRLGVDATKMFKDDFPFDKFLLKRLEELEETDRRMSGQLRDHLAVALSKLESPGSALDNDDPAPKLG